MKFALVGAAGYVAPRHLEAIRDLGHQVVAVADPHDSVGVLDRFFPSAVYYPDLESLVDDWSGVAEPLDYVSICSPNDLHERHIRLALEAGAHAICEKPLVLDPAGLDRLARTELSSGRRVFGIHQLRHHETLQQLRHRLHGERTAGTRHRVVMTYVTPRGAWYRDSWKGDPQRSGGLAANIGVHLFDLLLWFFGGVRSTHLDRRTDHHMTGRLDLEHADVEWLLSIDESDLPEFHPSDQPFRSLRIDELEVPFDAPPGLHHAVYRAVLAGDGLGIDDVRPAVQLVHELQRAPAPSAQATDITNAATASQAMNDSTTTRSKDLS